MDLYNFILFLYRMHQKRDQRFYLNYFWVTVNFTIFTNCQYLKIFSEIYREQKKYEINKKKLKEKVGETKLCNTYNYMHIFM